MFNFWIKTMIIKTINYPKNYLICQRNITKYGKIKNIRPQKNPR